jgi:hypothetical protein
VSTDFPHGVSTISSDAVAKPLPSITYSDNALGIAIPGYIIDAARDDVVFSYKF